MSRRAAAACLCLLVALAANAGEPLTDLVISTESGCPQLPSHSGLGGGNGALTLEYAFPMPTSVPGRPVVIKALYSSALDDPGTYGSRLHLTVRSEDREATGGCGGWPSNPDYVPHTIKQASIEFPDTSQVGFGRSGATSGMGCNASRSTLPAFDSNTSRTSRTGFGDSGFCRGGYDHDCKSSKEVSLSFPIPGAASTSASSYYDAASACTGRPDVSMGLTTRGVQSLTPRATLDLPSTSVSTYDYGGSCAQPVYLEGSADDSYSRMGRNWEHSLAWRIVPAGSMSGTAVVVQSPTGARTVYQSSSSISTPVTTSVELPRTPLDSGCGCLGARLFATRRSEALPDITSAFDAYELVEQDGSRMVFTRYTTDGVPAGRLVRMEENHGRNPIALRYDAGNLSEVIDSGGYIATFTYDEGMDERLIAIGLPGGRSVALDYTDGWLLELKDPVQVARNLPGYTFTYGGTEGLDDADITCRTEPDGLTFHYEYVSSGPNAGRLESASQAANCTTEFTYNTISYEYSTPDDAERWVKVIPDNDASAPTTVHVMNGQGQVVRVESWCTSNCPRIPEISTDKDVVAVFTEYDYDQTGQPRAVRRYPLVQGTSGGPTPMRDERSTISCVSRDATEGRVTQILGPTCVIETSSSVYEPLDGWDAANCDCDAWQQRLEQPDSTDCGETSASWGGLSGATPVGTAVHWEYDVAVGGLPALPSGVDIDRPSAVIAASQRLELMQPTAACAATRVFYYPVDSFDGQPDDLLHAVCPPSFTDTTPDAGCRIYTYHTWTSPLGGETVAVATVTDEGGNEWSFAYDSTHRQLQTVTAPTSASYTALTTLGYSAEGWVDTVEGPGDLLTEISYNARGQVAIRSSGASGGDSLSTLYNYSPTGRLRRIAEPDHHPASGTSAALWFTYDHRGLPVEYRRGSVSSSGLSSTDTFALSPLSTAESSATLYRRVGWDSNFVPVIQFTGTDGSGDVSNYRAADVLLDGFGNVRSGTIYTGDVSDPDYVLPWKWCETTDPLLGTTISRQYALSAPDGPTFDDGCTATEGIVQEEYTRDRAGRLTRSVMRWIVDSSTSGQHATCVSRDPWGRVVAQHDEVQATSATDCEESFRSSWPGYDLGFDTSDRPLMIAHSIGQEEPFAEYELSYDALGRLESASEGRSGTATEWGYRPDGRLQSMFYQVGLLTWGYVLGYDDELRLDSAWEGRVPPVVLGGGDLHTYTYDDFGRLKTATFAPNNSPTTPVYDWEYTYSSDNPWQLEQVDDILNSVAVRSFATDDHDRLTDTGYSYHSWSGALTEEPTSAGGRRFRWDSAGRLLAVIHDNDEGTAYSYDPSGRLVSRRSVTLGTADELVATTDPPQMHLWNGWSQAGTVDADVTTPNLRWFDGPVSKAAMHESPNTPEMLYRDHQGTLRTDPESTPLLEPFGEEIVGAVTDPAGFQGQEWRDESGLYYMRHRWYDPLTKRFISREPLTGGPVQNYSFVENAPTMWSDSMGLLPEHFTRYLDDAYLGGGEAALFEAAIDLVERCATDETSRANAAFIRGLPILAQDQTHIAAGLTWYDTADGAPFMITIDRSILTKWDQCTYGADVYYPHAEHPGHTIGYTRGESLRYDALISVLFHEAHHAVFDRLGFPESEHGAAYAAGTSVLEQLWSNKDCPCY